MAECVKSHEASFLLQLVPTTPPLPPPEPPLPHFWTDFRKSEALRCPPIQHAKRHKAGTRNGNKAYNALSFSLTLVLPTRHKLSERLWILILFFSFFICEEADMQHCFLLSPWLPAGWLVEDQCRFVMRVAQGGHRCDVARARVRVLASATAPLLWRQRRCVWCANLISHPVGALLPQAQGRRDKTQQFVHVLIANPPAERDSTR